MTKEVIIDGIKYIPEKESALRVSIHGMYDRHCFHKIEGNSVNEIINNWMKHNSKPIPAIVESPGGKIHEVEDLGPSMLCSAIVLDENGKELRCVGKPVMVNDKTRKPRNKKELDKYRKALMDDPDISRILKENGTKT